MAKLLSKRIGSTIIRGSIVPHYAQTLSAVLHKALIDRGIDTSPSRFDGTFKVGSDSIEVGRDKVNQESYENFLQYLEKTKAQKTQEREAATSIDVVKPKNE